MSNTDRRTFLKLTGMTAMMSAMQANIAKALAIPANHRTGTINDVEHIVILMQENRPFDHHFGNLRGVRGYSDPRAVKINLPLASGTGTTPVPVFLQPAGAANTAAGYAVAPDTVGGPADGADVLPPFRVNPASFGLSNLGGSYFPGTNHGWGATHAGWNQGQYDNWPNQNGPWVMSYVNRDDLPYHYALADAFTIGDAYHCSIMGPTNPNRCYLWTGSIGNVDYLGAGGTDGAGAGPVTYNGLSVNNQYFVWETFPEVLDAAGVSWKFYQDLAGATFAPDFGDGTGNSFAGNYTDNSVLYFKQYADSSPGMPLYDNGCTGTQIINSIPATGSPDSAWKAWAEGLFAEFRSDVSSGKLPQVSWILTPAGYTEHSDYPLHYGAWYISQIMDILVSNPEVFSKTVFIINYDEADGSFDHIVPPCPPPTPAAGASTVNYDLEIVTTSTPNGPIGLGTRVSFLAISPWSKGGYVVSEVFDHTSTIQFIEKRFGVYEKNISPWRRAVSGDLTSAFNFADPDQGHLHLPSTSSFLPTPFELAGGNVNDLPVTPADVIIGVPTQEKGIRPARALPYEIDAHASVSGSTVTLKFSNTGKKTAVFHVRSGNPADEPRFYTVEPGKSLSGTWSASSTYSLSVYGPNGFVRFFNGTIGGAALDVRSRYGSSDSGSISLTIRNLGGKHTAVTVLDAYSGDSDTQHVAPHDDSESTVSLGRFHGWYDLVITVDGDSTFNYRFAGHVETGRDSFSDPALGGLVTLKA
jgi:phospholipase C